MNDIRLIDANALKEKLSNSINVNDIGKGDWWEGYAQGLELCAEFIDNAPTIDISKEVWNKSNELLEKRLTYLERPQGEWVKDEEYSITINMFKCSNCSGGGYPHFKYCPHCGAVMDNLRGEKE